PLSVAIAETSATAPIPGRCGRTPEPTRSEIRKRGFLQTITGCAPRAPSAPGVGMTALAEEQQTCRPPFRAPPAHAGRALVPGLARVRTLGHAGAVERNGLAGSGLSAGGDLGRGWRQLRPLLGACDWGRALPVRRAGRQSRGCAPAARGARRPGLALLPP